MQQLRKSDKNLKLSKKRKMEMHSTFDQVSCLNYLIYIFNWDSLHARLICHYKAWSSMKKKHKKIKAYRNSIHKEPIVKRCLLILDLKPLRS